MANKKNVLDELAKLETIMLQIEQVSQRDDEKRWRDLIDLRRALAVQTGIANQTALSYPRLMDDPEASLALREKMSVLRTANADHQANWPAPEVARDPQGYAK